MLVETGRSTEGGGLNRAERRAVARGVSLEATERARVEAGMGYGGRDGRPGSRAVGRVPEAQAGGRPQRRG